MKIKMDFVTNSSSTSFCGWGIIVEGFYDLPEKIRKKIYGDYVDCTTKKYPGDKILSYEEFEEHPNKNGWDSHLQDLLKGTHMDVGIDCRYDYIMYIGISPDNEDVQDMTINQIKKLSEKELREIGLEDGVSFIEEGWYDG